MPIGNGLAVIISKKVEYFDFNIIISSDTSQYELYPALVLLGWNKVLPIKGTVIVNAGVVMQGGASTVTTQGAPAFTIAKINRLSIINIRNYGSIIGSGGNGGTLDGEGGAGHPGGDGINCNIACNINILNNGTIAGGGGGGGGMVGGGGGGAGLPIGKGAKGINFCPKTVNGQPGSCYGSFPYGNNGSRTTGGRGGSPLAGTYYYLDSPANGGKGGDLGTIGDTSGIYINGTIKYSYPGGYAGKAINYPSYGTGKLLDPSSTGTIIG